MLAGAMLLEDLAEVDSQSFRSMYLEQFAGAAPGRPASLEPEHWALALLAAPEIRLSLSESGGRNPEHASEGTG